MLEDYVETIKEQVEKDFSLENQDNKNNMEYPYSKYYFDAYLVFNMYLYYGIENKEQYRDMFKNIVYYNAIIDIILDKMYYAILLPYDKINITKEVDKKDIVEIKESYLKCVELLKEIDKKEVFNDREKSECIKKVYNIFKENDKEFNDNEYKEEISDLSKYLDAKYGFSKKRVAFSKKYRVMKKLLNSFNLDIEYDDNNDVRLNTITNAHNKYFNNKIDLYSFVLSLSTENCLKIIKEAKELILAKLEDSFSFIGNNIVLISNVGKEKESEDASQVFERLREIINDKDFNSKVGKKDYKEHVGKKYIRCFALMEVDKTEMVYFALSGVDYDFKCHCKKEICQKSIYNNKKKQRSIDAIAIDIKDKLLNNCLKKLFIYSPLINCVERFEQMKDFTNAEGLPKQFIEDIEYYLCKENKNIKDAVYSIAAKYKYTCCERKMIANYQHIDGNKKSFLKFFIKYSPCKQCSMALCILNNKCSIQYLYENKKEMNNELKNKKCQNVSLKGFIITKNKG